MSELETALATTGQETILDLIKRSQAQFALALANDEAGKRFTRVALTAVRSNPDLQKANSLSLLGALMICAQLDLEPSGPLGHAYLVPFKKEVQLIIGYKGMIELAYRSGRVAKIVARVVREGDEFDYSFGLEDVLVHKPTPGGAMTHVYAVGKVAGGDPVSVVLTKDEVDAVRKRFAKGGDKGPWSTDYEAMAMKTAVRRLFTWLPSSSVPQPALAADGGVVSGIPESLDELEDVIDVEEAE